MENDKKQPQEMPSIKKIVDCPRCKAKIEVEFEIDVERFSLPITFPPKEKGK